jgi:hypothetical protein
MKMFEFNLFYWNFDGSKWIKDQVLSSLPYSSVGIYYWIFIMVNWLQKDLTTIFLHNISIKFNWNPQIPKNHEKFTEKLLQSDWSMKQRKIVFISKVGCYSIIVKSEIVNGLWNILFTENHVFFILKNFWSFPKLYFNVY